MEGCKAGKVVGRRRTNKRQAREEGGMRMRMRKGREGKGRDRKQTMIAVVVDA